MLNMRWKSSVDGDRNPGLRDRRHSGEDGRSCNLDGQRVGGWRKMMDGRYQGDMGGREDAKVVR